MNKSFKNFIAITSALSFLLSSTNYIADLPDSEAAEHRGTYTLFGDLNDDGCINAFDVALMRKSVGKNEYSSIADLNSDAKVDEADLQILNDYVLGKDSIITAYLNDDTDKDGICDLAEVVYLKLDPDSDDTDNDGLSDYNEILKTHSDPSVFDSIEKGVSDSKADPDNDGLSNAEEVKLSSDPNRKDSDGDGLDDAYEITTLKTDCNKKDTDDDGLTDFEEEKLELDPLNKATDGTNDGERIIKQVIKADDPLLSKINTDDNAYELSVEINAAGYAQNCLKINNSGYAYALKDSSAIGTVPELIYNKNFNVESVTLKFKIKEAFRDNVSHYFDDVQDDYYDYNFEVDPELDGIKRLNVFKYFQSVNLVMPIETYYDTENDTVCATIDTFEKDDDGNTLGIGSYSLVDLEVWASMMNEPEEDNNASAAINIDVDNVVLSYPDVSILADSAKASSEKKTLKKITDDERELISRNYQSSNNKKGTLSDQSISSCFGHKYAFYDSQSISWADAQSKCRAKGGHLMTINSPFEFSFLNGNLSSGRSGGLYWLGAKGGSGNWSWITGESTSYARTITVSGYTMDRCENYFSALGNCLAYCPGLAYLSEGFPSYSKIRGYICEWEPGAIINDPESNMVSVNTGSGTASLLQAVPDPDSNTDSDGDGISDWDEIDHDAIARITGDNSAVSVAWDAAYDYLKSKGLLGTAAADNQNKATKLLKKPGRMVVPSKTNITSDSDDDDEDGIPNAEDTDPQHKGLSGGIVGKLTIVSSWTEGSLGHSWLMYKSYVNDSFKVENYKKGYYYNTETKQIEQVPVIPEYYNISRNKYVSLGNFSDYDNETTLARSSFGYSCGGMRYNEEFNCYDCWPDIAAYSREVTEDQFYDFTDYCNESSWYYVYDHNCSTIASKGWEAAFGTSDGFKPYYYVPSTALHMVCIGAYVIEALEADTPMALKENIERKSGHLSATDFIDLYSQLS